MNRREVKRAPVLRFKGFTNDWEQHTLGDFGSVAMNKRIFKNQTTDKGDVPFFKISTFGKKADSFISNNLFEKYKEKYPYPQKGDLLISASGSIGRIVEYKGQKAYYQDSNIVWLNHNKELLNIYLKAYYQIIHWHGIEGSTIKRLYNKNILATSIFVPDKKEQYELGKLIKKAEKIISLQQRKNILLYKLRKSLLSTLLTDKCTPKVRFKSFLEPLKKQKLGDMAPLRGGFAFKANNYVNTGIPIIRISNILSNGSIGGNFAYYSEQSDDSNYILFNGSALIAMSGATTGKTAILDLEKKKKVYQNQRVGYFTPTKNSDYSFIKAIIKSNYFLKQLNSIMVAGAQPNVSAVDIDNFTFYFPESKKEQKYIGNNFEIINKIILLQKNRVDKLKKLKRSLLQQLFI